MNERNILLLLQIIKTNGNINKLRRQKLSFKQIAEITDTAVYLEYLTNNNDKITLTSIGEEFLFSNEAKLKEKNKWIDPDFRSKIVPIDKNDVFLPSQNELSFLKELL